MKCKKNDCFSCPYPDCINSYIRPRYELSPEQKEMDRIRNRERYHAMRAAGMCVQCLHRPAIPGRTKCLECNNWFNRYKRERSHAAGTPSRSEMDGIGLCTCCGKHPPLEDHKVCESCYAKLLVSLRKANAQRAALAGRR